MNVILLAAGKSERLKPLTNTVTKGLVHVAEGKSFIDIMLNNLSKYSTIKKIVIVGGHGFDRLKQEVGKNHKTLPIQFLYNDKYSTFNNCYSVYLAVKQYPHEDILIINSDVLADPKILQKAFAHKGTSLVIDNAKELTEESMKIIVKGKTITNINKKLPIRESFGEYIGIARIAKADIPKLLEALEHVVLHTPNLYYEDAFQLMFKDVEFTIITTDGLSWTEVDTHEDLALAKKMYEGFP